MKIEFLGQAGLLFRANDKLVLVDPYLSNSVSKVQPQNKRRQPIDEKYLSYTPDIIVITHNHLDHYDKETLVHYLNSEKCVKVLAPTSVFYDIKKEFLVSNEYILFDNGTSVSIDNLVFTAVKAVHSDEYAIGVIIQSDGKSYYVTGDTLYSEQVFNSLPNKKFTAVFLPINGKGSNMNVVDAEKFVNRLKVKKVVPIHFGMFDNMTGSELKIKKVVIPLIYKEIQL